MSMEQLRTLKAVLRERGIPGDPTVAEMRARMEETGEKFPAPPEAVVEPTSIAGRPAEWVGAPGLPEDRAVLYLHGGGYVIGSFNSHRNLAHNLARASGTRVLMLDYRLAPEHPFPAAVDDAVAAYEELLDRGFLPSRLSVAGDSAGGGLTVAALVGLRYRGRPMPAAGLCISPWTDMEGVGASMALKRDEDPMLNQRMLFWFAERYLAGADPRSPLGRADLRRPRRAAAAPHPGRNLRGPAGRLDPPRGTRAGPWRRCGLGHLPRHGACLAPVRADPRRGERGHRPGRNLPRRTDAVRSDRHRSGDPAEHRATRGECEHERLQIRRPRHQFGRRSTASTVSTMRSRALIRNSTGSICS